MICLNSTCSQPDLMVISSHCELLLLYHNKCTMLGFLNIIGLLKVFNIAILPEGFKEVFRAPCLFCQRIVHCSIGLHDMRNHLMAVLSPTLLQCRLLFMQENAETDVYDQRKKCLRNRQIICFSLNLGISREWQKWSTFESLLEKSD